MAIDITNTLNGHEEVLDVLLESNSVVFIDESHLYFVRSSDNGGWMYDIYNVEDCPKDEDGYPLLDEDDEVNSIDGGLCCGTAQDAIERIVTKASSYYDGKFKEEFRELIERGYMSLSSPIWANCGTKRGLPISCFSTYLPERN